jgi:hypothetical protein
MMRLESIPEDRIAYRTTDDERFAYDGRSGEILSAYPVHKTPLFQMYESAIRAASSGRGAREGELAEYRAGTKFAELYIRSGLNPFQGISRSDPSRIIVDGAGRAPDALGGSDGAKIALSRIETLLGPSYAILVGICGQEKTITGYATEYQKDWRSVKRKLKAGLSCLAEWFKKN